MGQACFVTAGGDQPAQRWMTYPAVEAGWPICTMKDAVPGLAPDADVYVVQLTPVKPPIERWHAKGKGVFFWLDDAVWMIPIRTKQALTWKKLWPEVSEWLGKADGIICPSRVLADDMTGYNSNVHYIPNYHRYEMISTSHAKTIYGYGGSYYHWTSWRDTEAWTVIPANRQVRIIALPMVASMIEDHRPDLSVTRLDRLEPEEYLQEISTWERYVIPCHGEYDRRRSWIKALECLIAGVPWIGVGDEWETVYAGLPPAKSTLEWTSARKWAEQQHIRYHLDEWKEVLCVR